MKIKKWFGRVLARSRWVGWGIMARLGGGGGGLSPIKWLCV